MQNITKALLLFVFDIPAIGISIFIFAYFITHRVARSNSKNHIWIIHLILNFVQLFVLIPMPTSFYYLGRIWPATNVYCVWWTWFEYSSNAASLSLMAWSSVERYFFIFYSRFLLGAWWKKWAYHFGPIILCMLWPSLWYMVVVVISPNCNNIWNFNQVICDIPCFTTVNGGIFGVLHLVLNILIPICILIFSNIALITRVIHERISRHQVVYWRRHRKMAFQLWLVSSFYMTGWLPLTFTGLIKFTVAPSFMSEEIPTIYFILYFIPLLSPMVYLFAFPEVITYTRKLFQRPKRNRVTIII